MQSSNSNIMQVNKRDYQFFVLSDQLIAMIISSFFFFVLVLTLKVFSFCFDFWFFVFLIFLFIKTVSFVASWEAFSKILYLSIELIYSI